MKKSELNILIVDDDKSIRESLTEAVKRKGYRAIPVGKVEEAESIVKIKPIHAVICDVMLPGRNGIDLVLKLKENLAESVAIVFISGIYKDKSFIFESLRKTDAIDYLIKPIDLEEVTSILNEKLREHLEAPQIDIHSLLSTSLTSNRDRRKAIDHLEQLSGFDLPFIISILMDSQSSGHLNIVDEANAIFGLTLAKGTVVRVDSESSLIQTKKLLLRNGFISELELGEVKNGNSDLIRSLVEQSLMSPHVSGLLKSETITSELKKLLPAKVIKINFALDRNVKEEEDSIGGVDFSQIIHDLIAFSYPIDWLKSFYSVWMGHPIRLGPQFSDHHQYVAFPLMKQVEGLIDLLKSEVTLEDIIAQCPQFSEEKIYKAIHFLMLRRALVFEESRRVKNIDDHINRLRTMFIDLHDKNPVEVFNYFGLGSNPKPIDLARTYKEFAKSHHPDMLTKHVNEEVRKMNHVLFAHVTSAYETLSNTDLKDKFFNQIKQQEAEIQMKSEEMVSAAAVSLSRGRYSEALPMLESAMKLYQSDRTTLHYWWVKFKVEGQMTPALCADIESQLKKMSQSMRQAPLWIFVNGLIKRFKGDAGAAILEFNKVLAIDEDFMDARREIANLKASGKKGKAGTGSDDILTGDLSTVIKNIFKKKGA